MNKFLARQITFAASVAVSIFLCAPANAGVFTDDLSKCVVKSSAEADRATMIQWMFSAASLNPVVKSMVSVTPAQRDNLNSQMAKLLVRLLASYCPNESIAALKNEGSSALSVAFSVLGQVAGRGIMSGPTVTAGLNGFESNIDRNTMTKLFKEAGLEYEAGAAKPK